MKLQKAWKITMSFYKSVDDNIGGAAIVLLRQWNP
jgi:hypothetical protein